MIPDEYDDLPTDAPPPKERALCCIRWREDHDGKQPIGFCGPDCHRRPKVWEAMR